MQISTILDNIDAGAITLPEFQRGYVWSRHDVRELLKSLYQGFPVGSLLLWKTATEAAPVRGAEPQRNGHVSLLLDGQQRITSLYGLARGHAPPFFDGDEHAFKDLRFHPIKEEFAFYAPVRMGDDPLWLEVTRVLEPDGMGWAIERLQNVDGTQGDLASLLDPVNRLRQILAINLHDEEITGEDKTIDVVVELFNKVNSAGRKLSKGDLALAKLCARSPRTREELKRRLAHWSDAGFSFSMDWLLRNVTTVTTGKAELAALESVEIERFRQGLDEAERSIDYILNLASSRLGLDHDRVLGAVAAIPLMTRLVAERGGRIEDPGEADCMLHWYVHAMLWGRYSGSTETVLNTDLQALRTSDPFDALMNSLRMQRGGDSRVRPEDFGGSTVSARFYPLLYMLTRVQGARDLKTGLELRRHLLGRRAALEVHHLFPKKLLYEHDFSRPEVNALANFSFLTGETNRSLADTPPAEYLPECERQRPGVLASHWIPAEPELWSVERYRDFLAARRELLAKAANDLLEDLWTGGLGGETEQEDVLETGSTVVVQSVDDESREVESVQTWMVEKGFRNGIWSLALFSLDGGAEEAVIDLAWPDGLRYGEGPVALLIDEPPDVQDAAVRHGYRCFTTVEDLKRFAERDAGDSGDDG